MITTNGFVVLVCDQVSPKTSLKLLAAAAAAEVLDFCDFISRIPEDLRERMI